MAGPEAGLLYLSDDRREFDVTVDDRRIRYAHPLDIFDILRDGAHQTWGTHHLEHQRYVVGAGFKFTVGHINKLGRASISGMSRAADPGVTTRAGLGPSLNACTRHLNFGDIGGDMQQNSWGLITNDEDLLQYYSTTVETIVMCECDEGHPSCHLTNFGLSQSLRDLSRRHEEWLRPKNARPRPSPRRTRR